MSNQETPPAPGRSAATRRFDHDLRQFADNLELGGFTALSAGIGLGPTKKPEPQRETLGKSGACAAGMPRVAPTAPVLRQGVQGATGVSPAAYAAGAAAPRPQKAPRKLTRDQKKAFKAQAKQHAAAQATAQADALAQQRHQQSLVNEANGGAFAAHDGQAVRAAQTAASAKAREKAKRRLPLERKILAFGLDLSFVAFSLTVVFGLATVLAAVKGGVPPKRLTDWLALPPLTWLATFRPEQLLLGTYALFAAYWLVFRLVAGRTLGGSLAARGMQSGGVP